MVDFSVLRQQGIGLIQQLCRDTWTDYNLHDPGVTILEALCYAITDLSYRTEFPIADILADKEGNIRLEENAFFIREDILCANPVTVNDFRKFVLDRMDKLHNVWLEPFISGFSYGTMHGLYTMKVQVRKEFTHEFPVPGSSAGSPTGSSGGDNEWITALKGEVRACFVSARNLCEDLTRNVIILRPVPIRIRAEVIITGHDPEKLLAAIYRELETAINPPVRYYTERELLDKGYRVEDIYAGPLLKKGFIPDEELGARNLTIDPIELMKAISLVEGVSYVRSLTIEVQGRSIDRMPYILDEGAYAYFEDGLSESPIVLVKDKYEVGIRESVFNDLWLRVQEAARRNADPVVNRRPPSRVRQGRYRDLSFYYSLQHLFPVIYGIGPDGPGKEQSPERKAGARQLKAYLLFFEQVLANYLSQLANVSNLFAIDTPDAGPAAGTPDGGPAAVPCPPTYYSQPLYEVPGIRLLLQAFTDIADPDDDGAWAAFTEDKSNRYMRALAESVSSDEVSLERKNAILDHLLARFNEKPAAYPVQLFVAVYEDKEKEKGRDAVIEWKSRLLKNMVLSGYGRVRGFNYLAKGADDGCGFYNKMAALLYIPPIRGKGILLPDAVVNSPAVPRPGQSWHPGRRKMSYFRDGIHTGNYHIGQEGRGSSQWVISFREPPEGKDEVIGRYPDEPSAKAGLQHLIDRLRQMSILSEGFYVVEHVLLRPPADTISFGFCFSETKKDILLRHTRWTSFKERENIIAGIMEAAETAPDPGPGGMAEWAVRNLGDLCRAQLSRHKEFGYMGDPLDLEQWSWKEAAPDFENIRRKLLQFKENRLRFYPRFEMLVKGQDEEEVKEEFFNFNMTVVFPAWPARFQDPNFRKFAMDLFRMHTPAHIRILFQWLNISRMKEFEQLYLNWTDAMKNPDNPEAASVCSGRLVHFLRRGS